MEIRIDNNYEGRLIRDVLRNELGYSASLIKKLKFSENGILVNGQWVTVRYELRHGDVLTLSVEDKPEDVSPYIIPAPLDLPVIYEDEWVTAVNKPYKKLVVGPWVGSAGPPLVCTGRLVPSAGDALLVLTGRVVYWKEQCPAFQWNPHRAVLSVPLRCHNKPEGLRGCSDKRCNRMLRRFPKDVCL